ncbi:MAG: DNA-protecting protein DprA [Candidatus Liptonbacteria bacterium]|nr:DNA-protecting protein DprA [Candidatus Liptonbacteria bacterium]
MTEEIFYNAATLVKWSNFRELENLKKKYSTWQKVWASLSTEVKKSCSPEKEWAKLEKAGVSLTLSHHPHFPALLKEIPWTPFGIYSLGNLNKINQTSLAIVGTRKASESGREIAKKFARKIAGWGINVISGLALGIDAKSHEGALEAKGYTVAVIASGLDKLYPKTNEKLAQKILGSGGAIISEYPLGSPSLPQRFIERNRLVSGLAHGLLVIEAPQGSGALATTRFALDQNRDVFVVPGPITHPNFIGSHELIRQGAALVTKPEEILEILAPALLEKENSPRRVNPETEEEKIILEVLLKSGKPVTIDKIIELTNLNAKIINQTLSFLTLKNSIQETDQGYTL